MFFSKCQIGGGRKEKYFDNRYKACNGRTLCCEKVISNLIKDYCEEQEFDCKEIWLACSNGFSEELKNYATKRVMELGFQKINWVDMGGVITTHGGPSTFYIAGFTRECEKEY